MLTSDQVVSEIARIIADDPTIRNADRITVSVARTGPLFRKKEEIRLGGTAQSEIDKKKAAEAAQRYSAGRAVINEIRVPGNAEV